MVLILGITIYWSKVHPFLEVHIKKIPLNAFDDACAAGCPAVSALRLIGGRWKIPILYHLQGGPRRFSELRRRLPGITQKMLTLALRELEADALVRRKIYPQVPPKVVYSLTPLGKSAEPAIAAMCQWGACRRKKTAAPRAGGGCC